MERVRQGSADFWVGAMGIESDSIEVGYSSNPAWLHQLKCNPVVSRQRGGKGHPRICAQTIWLRTQNSTEWL